VCVNMSMDGAFVSMGVWVLCACGFVFLCDVCSMLVHQ